MSRFASNPTGWRRLGGMAFAVLLIAITFGRANADVINVDVSGVDPRYRGVFLQAEALWEQRIQDFSPDLPQWVRSQLQDVEITASTADIDGVGGVLAQAGVTETFSFNNIQGAKGVGQTNAVISQAGQMQFDNADLEIEFLDGSLVFTIAHEMGHALGFGSLWTENNLVSNLGEVRYIGKYALDEYRKETRNRFAPFVPVENQGGPGSAGSHWDDSSIFFDNQTGAADILIAFDSPETFITETTWGAFADLWFEVKGINDDGVGGGPQPPGTVNGPKTSAPGSSSALNSIPEPSHYALLAMASLVGLIVMRRKKA